MSTLIKTKDIQGRDLLVNLEQVTSISQRLGHSTIRLTADTYISVLQSLQKGTATKLENLLYGT